MSSGIIASISSMGCTRTPNSISGDIQQFVNRNHWNYTRYTPHRRPWRFGHFLQLALTFVHQHFLQGTSVYLRFVPFFQCFRRRCSAVKNWVGDMGPWCCRQAHCNTSSETIGERTVCNNVCNVQGTLTCPTPPQPLPHILAVAEHQQRVQRTRNVNMPHPTPAPAPHPGSCGTSTTCATYKER